MKPTEWVQMQVQGNRGWCRGEEHRRDQSGEANGNTRHRGRWINTKHDVMDMLRQRKHWKASRNWYVQTSQNGFGPEGPVVHLHLGHNSPEEQDDGGGTGAQTTIFTWGVKAQTCMFSKAASRPIPTSSPRSPGAARGGPDGPDDQWQVVGVCGATARTGSARTRPEGCTAGNMHAGDDQEVEIGGPTGRSTCRWRATPGSV